MKKAVIALVVCVCLITTGCSSSWLKIALADLPVLTQMALNVGTLITAVNSGHQLSASDQAIIQNISKQTSADLNLVQAYVNDYEASNTQTNLQKVEAAISDAQTNLAASLQAAHITDPVMAGRVSAGVNLILATIESFATLMPAPPAAVVHAQVMRRSTAGTSGKGSKPPKPNDLKKAWNQQVAPQFQVSGFWGGLGKGLGNAIGEAKWGS